MLQTYITNFYEWGKWEGISHHLLLVLFVYIIYIFASKKSSRTVTNILLLTIVVALETMIHQNMNIKNNKQTQYV
jgi:hypothetical protein